jgi:predicted RecB family nuclease
MGFSDADRSALLALKGVGPTVVSRLEQMGFESINQLADAELEQILEHGAGLTGSSCWKNSPQARAAIGSVLALAQTSRQPATSGSIKSPAARATGGVEMSGCM